MSAAIRIASTAVLLALALSLTGCASARVALSDWWQQERDRLLTEDAATPTPPAPVPPAPGDSTNPPPENPAVAPDAGAGGTTDALDLSTVSWLGEKVTTSNITAKITAASTDGTWLYTTYEPYSWPSNGTQPKPCDAIAHFFYEQGGKIVGGKFDWWSNGGQARKGLENVHTGYHGHKAPVKGTRAWTMISSIDGKQRSNVAEVSWR